jgi:hypothetical protein
VRVSCQTWAVTGDNASRPRSFCQCVSEGRPRGGGVDSGRVEREDVVGWREDQAEKREERICRTVLKRK